MQSWGYQAVGVLAHSQPDQARVGELVSRLDLAGEGQQSVAGGGYGDASGSRAVCAARAERSIGRGAREDQTRPIQRGPEQRTEG